MVSLAPACNGAAATGEVVEVRAGTLTDLVIVRGGFEAGFRQGMICRVVRGNLEVGELMMVELREDFATALITRLAPRQLIRSGDLTTVKVQRS